MSAERKQSVADGWRVQDKRRLQAINAELQAKNAKLQARVAELEADLRVARTRTRTRPRRRGVDVDWGVTDETKNSQTFRGDKHEPDREGGAVEQIQSLEQSQNTDPLLLRRQIERLRQRLNHVEETEKQRFEVALRDREKQLRRKLVDELARDRQLVSRGGSEQKRSSSSAIEEVNWKQVHLEEELQQNCGGTNTNAFLFRAAVDGVGPCALKMMVGSQENTDEVVFERERAVLQRLRPHPNIEQVVALVLPQCLRNLGGGTNLLGHGITPNDTAVAICVPLPPPRRQTLRDYVATSYGLGHRSLPVNVVHAVAVQVLKASEFLEANRFVHMGVQLDNVLIEVLPNDNEEDAGTGSVDDVKVQLRGLDLAVQCRHSATTGSLLWIAGEGQPCRDVPQFVAQKLWWCPRKKRLFRSRTSMPSQSGSYFTNC